MRVLLSAFACNPRHGGEPGSGWHWAVGLADEGCDVVALVAAGSRATIEEELARAPRERLRFEYVRVPRIPLLRSELVGRARYVLWQVAAHRRARALASRQAFDVVHHVTYGSLQGGSLLGRLGIPFVFGPVGGGQTAERELARWFGRSWRWERLRTLVTRRSDLVPLARSAVRRAATVVVVNDDTADLARRMGARRVDPMLDAALAPEFLPDDVGPVERVDGPGPFRVLWLARALPRKGLNLAITAFDRSGLDDAELVVVGGGPALEDATRLAASLGSADRIRFLGYLAHREIGEQLAAADVFLFTSLRDSGGSQLLEAAAFGLPMVVIDHHGAGDRLPDEVAHKVAVGPPDELVDGIGSALRALADDPERRRSMGEAARRFAVAHTWPEHVREMMGIYAESVRTHPAGSRS